VWWQTAHPLPLLHVARGSHQASIIGDLFYTDRIPPVIVDCSFLAPNRHLSVGDQTGLGFEHRHD